MDVLVVGWSDIVRRRVIPALTDLTDLGRVHVATTSDGPLDLATLGTHAGRAYTGASGVTRALTDLPPTLVYVSGRNTDHADRVLAALTAGHDVVVDKPAFLTVDERDRCLAAATAGDRMLAEAVVWPVHAQVVALRERLDALSLRTNLIQATFTIPPLPETNFRTDVRAGGGVVADMGVYAMSPGRVFGTGARESVIGSVTARADSGLDLAFACTARYADGLVVDGMFAFTGDYANRVALTGDGWRAALQPAYSSRPDATLTVAFTVDGQDHGFTVPPSDPFAVFLAEVLQRLADGDRRTLTARTAQSSDDLLALASALGVDEQWRRAPDQQESEDRA